MESVLNDLRYAVRIMRRAPGWTSVALLTLALGTGANAAVFNLVDALLFQPPAGVSAPSRVVTVFTSDFSSGQYGSSSYPDFLSIAAGVPALERVAAEDGSLVAPVRASNEVERSRVSRVSGGFFSLLGVATPIGRAITERDTLPGAAPVAVVSDQFWKRLLGARPVAGATIAINDKPFSVIGVAAAGFTSLDLGHATDIWIPLVPPMDSPEARGDRGLTIIGRLTPEANQPEAQAQLTALAASLARQYPATNLGTLSRPRDPRPMIARPLTRIPQKFRSDVSSLALVLMGGVGLVLLLACANVAGLLLSRATARSRETAVRRALGAGSRRLLRQSLTESAVLAVAASALGLLVAAWTSGLLPSFFPAEQAALLDAGLGWHVFAYAAGLAALASLLTGVLPAVRAIRPPLATVLRGYGDTADLGGARARTVLVSVQVAIASLLLTGAALLAQSATRSLNADLGMTTRQAVLASVELPSSWTRADGLSYYDAARDRVAAIPGVESAAWVRTLVLARTSRRGFRPDGYTFSAGEDRELNVNYVSAGYFETLGVALRAGRTFTARDSIDRPRVVVVNETLARRFFGGRAVGKRLTESSNAALEIVGVVEDTKYLTVGAPPPPLVYYPLAQAYSPAMTLVARTRVAPETLVAAIRRDLRAINAEVPVFGARTLRSHIEEALGAERLSASLVSVCGLLALVLATVGLYGAIAYLVARRTREIGVRIALGATPERIVGLVATQALRIAGFGILAGLGVAAVALRALPLVLYGVTPLDARTYLAVLALVALTAAIACAIPARRAARIDPARALSAE